jgi:hypothetical protein
LLTLVVEGDAVMLMGELTTIDDGLLPFSGVAPELLLVLIRLMRDDRPEESRPPAVDIGSESSGEVGTGGEVGVTRR